MKMSDNFDEQAKLLYERIIRSNSILLASHINPDGDSIGSMLAIGLALKKLKDKDVKLVKTDNIPSNLNFLPKIDEIETIDVHQDIDLLITLDCSDFDRLGKSREILEKAKFIVNIDHHVTNENFGQINIVEDRASSTGEIVYNLLSSLNMEIDSEIATCIYVAISTDTGSFKYESTSANTHIIASELLKHDININEIIVNLYQNRSLEKTNLLIKALNSIELYENNTVGFVSITQDMLNETNSDLNDSDGIIEFIRDISSIEVACILKEVSGSEIKAGLRSKRFVDVSKIAATFQGGGHPRASGCTFYGDVLNAKLSLLEEIKKHLR